MLKRLSVKGRIYTIIVSIFLLFVTMVMFSVGNSNGIKGLSIQKIGNKMLDDQKARIQLATHAAARMVEAAISGINDEKQVKDIVRDLVDTVIYEEDRSGYIFVYEGTVAVAFPVKKESVGKDLGGITDPNGVKVIQKLRDTAQNGGGFVRYIWPKPGAGDQPKLSYAEMIKGTNMWIGTGVYIDNIEAYQEQMAQEISASVNQSTTTMIMVSGIIFAAIIALCLFIAVGIVRELNALLVNFQDIAEGEGDLTKRIEIESKDEIAKLATLFNTIMKKLQSMIRKISNGVETLTSSSSQLSAISQQMAQGIEEVTGKSNTVSAAAEEMSTNMNNVAAAMEQSATNITMVASASEEMSATIDEIAKNTEKARGISRNAADRATDASSNMDQLGAAANAIGKVIETITDISEQVNLLALNATIEAARAGEAGKGFAVVANEIKELAKQTAAATGDIKEKIEGIQGTTNMTVSQITEVTQVIADINEVVAIIATAVEEQSATTREISNNVSQASVGIQEVNENVNQSSAVSLEISKEISGVSGSMSEMSVSGDQVNESAHTLFQVSENLRQLVLQFKI